MYLHVDINVSTPQYQHVHVYTCINIHYFDCKVNTCLPNSGDSECAAREEAVMEVERVETSRTESGSEAVRVGGGEGVEGREEGKVTGGEVGVSVGGGGGEGECVLSGEAAVQSVSRARPSTLGRYSIISAQHNYMYSVVVVHVQTNHFLLCSGPPTDRGREVGCIRRTRTCS